MESHQPSSNANVPNEVLSHIFVCSCSDSVLPYDQDRVPCQVILSQVCSKWCQVALSTGALWSNITVFDDDIIQDYRHGLFLYQTWVRRAGAHPLTVAIDLVGDDRLDEEGVFEDLVLPFQIKKLDMRVMYESLPRLSNLPTLNVEEFAISLNEVKSIKNFAAPPFMNKTWSIYLRGDELDVSPATLKELCLPWQQLRSLECDTLAVHLSTLLDALKQAPSLEQCHLTIYRGGSGPLVGISMPSLRRLTLELKDVELDIIIPLFTTQNLTTLIIRASNRWASDTYDTLRRHHKLHQLQEIQLSPGDFPLSIAQVLVDAPMVHQLHVEGKPVVDAEALEGIASKRLGRYLSSLHLGGCSDHAGDWLDMIETRERNVNATVAQVSNWRQMIPQLKVEFSDVENIRDYRKRVAALKALGTTVTLFPNYSSLVRKGWKG